MHLEKFSLNFSRSSLTICVNLLHHWTYIFQTNHVVHWNVPCEDIFPVWRHDFFRTTWCSFAKYLSSRGKLTGLFAFENRAKFVLIIFHLQLINSGHADSSMADKSMVAFLLSINMLWMNITQSEKPWHHTENISSRGAFQCATWLVWNKFAAYIEMHHVTSKTLLRKRQKNSWVSRSTGKSSNRDQEVNPI